MSPNRVWIDIVQREWILWGSFGLLAAGCLYLKKTPVFSVAEGEVFLLLWGLFVCVKGLEQSGWIMRWSRRIEQGRGLPIKLVATTFVLSMIVTNDVALIVMVPLTLALHTDRKDILVVLEALAANAGSALTPLGNPQNLFIYWYYHVQPLDFVATIAPFSIFFLVVLVSAATLVKTENHGKPTAMETRVERSVVIYGGLLLGTILTVLRILPVPFGAAVLVYAALFDRKALRVDYSLLLTFLCLFGLSDISKTLFASQLEHSGHVFLLSALSSQVMSNVPATLLFSKFTTQWEALLWGANAGGFGSLISSFANMIAYKLYINHGSQTGSVRFAVMFMAFGYAMFFLAVSLYFVLPSR